MDESASDEAENPARRRWSTTQLCARLYYSCVWAGIVRIIQWYQGTLDLNVRLALLLTQV